MIILPERGLVRTKFLQPIPERDWRTPSQAQPKNCFGHESQTRFRVRALLGDGHVSWIGIFDDFEDFDAFLWAIANGTLKSQRALWDLPAETWTPREGWGNVGWHPWLDDPAVSYDFVTLSFITSGSSWSVPANCNGIAARSGEFIDTIGAGGSGAAGGNGAATSGGAGGAWSRFTGTLSMTPGGSISIGVGVGGAGKSQSATGSGSAGVAGAVGGDTWFNHASFASATVGAKGGAGGDETNLNVATAATGGDAASRPNSGSTSGNNGGNSGSAGSFFGFRVASGGAGAAGPNGAGSNSANNATNQTGGAGASGDAGSGGAAGTGLSATSGTAGAGGGGTEYDASHGSGGGGGGAGSTSASGGALTGGAPGSYGAGSGACSNGATSGSATTQAGGAGLIVVSFVPLVSYLLPRRQTRFFTRRF